MKKNFSKVVLFITGMVFFLMTAFNPVDLSQDKPIFFDDLESFLNSSQLKTAYTVWEDGALLDMALEKGHVFSGTKSMRVDVVGPNPQTLSTSASIYHLLQFTESNWTDGAGIRLWVNNLSRFPLSMTFNFKEMHNEFWAIAENSLFYLESAENGYLQQQGQYGNLIIPAFYKGFLVIPFDSFSVPEWNTAKGDEQLNLGQIESFSFGFNITSTELQRLYIDDIDILPESNFTVAQITGNTTVDIPQSGEHREPYSLIFPAEMDASSAFLAPEWTIDESSDDAVQMDTEGWLTIPAGTRPGMVKIAVDFPSVAESGKVALMIKLTDPQLGENPVSDEFIVPNEIKEVESENSAYLQFANQFETWASLNRAWFVLISVTAVVLVLILLTFLQNRLK